VADNAKPTFGELFRRWWKGEDAADGTPAVADAPRAAPVPADLAAQGAEATPEALAQARALVTGDLWGPGLTAPGHEDYILDVSHALRPDGKKSMVDLGAALGGAARIIAKKTSVWISAYESDPLKAAIGADQSTRAGLAKKVKYEPGDLESIQLPAAKFDIVWSKDALVHALDKDKVLAQAARCLKPGGQMVIIDWILPPKGQADPGFWPGGEPEPGYPWDNEDYAAGFARAKLDLRITEDQSHRYDSMITEAWSRWREVVANVEAAAAKSPADAPALMRALGLEADLWAARHEALQAGKAQVVRYFLIKN